ncbi:hypothetical protein DBR43_09910 [Pedobacter sp. KBW06]|uniref:hypothetical protein n=1 Tax=Pedobacter sp. KBW06 TaxID=2153359 RepID=UPI000F5B8467|nr:hypothetical protein [Pedobacter sp. KBW06]RQO75642.1 hypothetical protein DBR43_09910 [Pedobacter sp. KBW06]
MPNDVVRNKLSKKIGALSLDKDDLRKLLDILQQRAKTASEIEYKRFEETKVENLEQFKHNMEICSMLKITVVGFKSEELFGTIEDVFGSVSFPDSVKTIYVNSDVVYRANFNYYPSNHFQLYIDFSKPKVFDFSFQPSDRTPNDSEFIVQGDDSMWVNGVFHEIDAFVKDRPSKAPKIHRGSVYDLLVWLVGLPLGFYICNKYQQSPFVASLESSFLNNLAMTYFFFLSLFLLRVLFHYFRWVYPMIEYKCKRDRSAAHQAAVLSITLGIVGKVLYDVFQNILR